MSNIEAWLSELKLEKYITVFDEAEIDLLALPYLTEEILIELGLPLGPRLKIISAIKSSDREPIEGLEHQTNEDGVITAPIRAERRQVTILFADMVGYTPLAEKLEEEKTYLVMQQVHRGLSEAVHAYEGTVQELTGDGIMALFGAPVAFEDALLQACRAALDIQKRMVAIGRQIEAEHGMRPTFRVGLHSGPLIIGAVGDNRKMKMTALGDTVNFAARLESEAENGTVLMSEAMHDLVAEYVDSTFSGTKVIKGKSKPQKVFRLDAIKSDVSRFDISRKRGLMPLLGRQSELAVLEAAWEEVKGGNVRVVNVSGQAGIGKSRLVHEFQTRFDDKVFILQGNCTSDGQSASLLPFIEVVRRSFAFTQDAGHDEAQQKLQRGLEALGLRSADYLPYLLRLLGYEMVDEALDNIADEAIGIRTRDVILAMLQERCRKSPTIMIIEDLHWIDSASEALLSRIADLGKVFPLLVILTHRPEYRPPWIGAPSVINHNIEPLSQEVTTNLILGRLGVGEMPEDFSRLIADKAEGNPLFAEEITNYLIDTGNLEGNWMTFPANPQPKTFALPINLENMLLTRFDRLNAEAREVLEAASVLGLRFSPDILGEVTKLTDSLAPQLEILVRQELIFSLPGEGQYRFKHALVQDAVYNSLLTSNREALHGKAADFIERQHSDRLMEVADTLAYHYSHTRQTQKAVRYLALAGEKSLNIYSLEEATQRFDQAMVLIENEPDSVDDSFLADLLLKIARVNYYRVDLKGILYLTDRYLERVESLGDNRRTSRFLFELGYASVLAGQAKNGKAMLERALLLGEEISDQESIGYACMGLMWNYIFWEQASEERRAAVEKLGKRARIAAKLIGDNWLMTKVIGAFSNEAAFWGRPNRVKHFDQQLLALSRETNDPRIKSEAHFRFAYSRNGSGDYDKAIEQADHSLRLSLCPMDQLFARHAKGMALAGLGRAEEGYDILGAVEKEMVAGDFQQIKLMVDLPLGAAMVAKGELGPGVRHITAAMKNFAHLGQPFASTYGNWMLGEIYLRMLTRDTSVAPRVVFKNIIFLLKTLPIIGWKAQHHMEISVQQARELDMPGHLVRCLCGLGLVHMARKNASAAKMCLEEARPMARSFNAKYLSKRINAALCELEARSSNP